MLLAVGTSRLRPAWALVAERPRGVPADPSVRGLREKLEGGTVVRAWHGRDSFQLEVQQGQTLWWLEGSPCGLVCRPAPLDMVPSGDAVDAKACGDALHRGPTWLETYQNLLAEVAKTEAKRNLRKAQERLQKRCVAIERDQAAIEQAKSKAHEATLFVPQLSSIGPGTTRLVTTDWLSGEPREVVFALDPSQSPRVQLEAVFVKAKRLRGGSSMAAQRRTQAEESLIQLEQALAQIDQILSLEALNELLRSLVQALPKDIRLDREGTRLHEAPKGQAHARIPYRQYQAEQGATILVGRDARSNDQLTVRIAKPGDLWLHAKNTQGSHVVVTGALASANIDPHLLLDAATLAAHFSDHRKERIVDVAYCDRRYVRKRKGSPAGQVELLREKVIAVRMEPERLQRLLASHTP